MEALDRQKVFTDLKGVLEPYLKEFKAYDSPGKFSLYTKKPVMIDGRPFEEVYFAGIKMNKNMVSFHFMPIYMNQSLRDKVPASLQKVLRGHTCFNLKELSPEMVGDIRHLLDLGVAGYKARGWL